MSTRLTTRHRAYEIAVTCFFSAIMLFQAGLVLSAAFGHGGGPRFWPLMNYAMYDDPHFENETVNAYYLLEGVLSDGSTVEIDQKDLGFSFWNYLHLGVDLQQGKPSAVALLMENYKNAAKLTEIHVKSLPLKITRDGGVFTPSVVVRSIPIGRPATP